MPLLPGQSVGAAHQLTSRDAGLTSWGPCEFAEGLLAAPFVISCIYDVLGPKLPLVVQRLRQCRFPEPAVHAGADRTAD